MPRYVYPDEIPKRPMVPPVVIFALFMVTVLTGFAALVIVLVKKHKGGATEQVAAPDSAGFDRSDPTRALLWLMAASDSRRDVDTLTGIGVEIEGRERNERLQAAVGPVDWVLPLADAVRGEQGRISLGFVYPSLKRFTLRLHVTPGDTPITILEEPWMPAAKKGDLVRIQGEIREVAFGLPAQHGGYYTFHLYLSGLAGARFSPAK